MNKTYLQNLIDEALTNAEENGYLPQLIEGGPVYTAKDLCDYDAEIGDTFSYEDVLAVVKELDYWNKGK